MEIFRKYKKLPWFDLLDRLEYDLKNNPEKSVYIELMDELKMRKLDSVSEGGTYKIKAPSLSLLERFKTRLETDSSFALPADIDEIQSLADFILS